MSFASDLLAKLKVAKEVVVEKSSELADRTKYGYEILSNEGDADALYKSLGRAVFEASKNGSQNDELINVLISQIEEKVNKIAELRAKLAEFKNAKVCSCGFENPENAAFCSKCGNPL